MKGKFFFVFVKTEAQNGKEKSHLNQKLHSSLGRDVTVRLGSGLEARNCAFT